MLLKDFYRIIENSAEEDILSAKILINPDHNIFDGHFPEQPVVPGVVQLQIIKELLESHLGEKLMINKVTQVKYLIPVIPDKDVEIYVNINIKKVEENAVTINAIIGYSEGIFTKAKLVLRNCFVIT